MKRHLLTLLFFLAIGAVVNVGVAWACAVRAVPELSEERADWWGLDWGEQDQSVPARRVRSAAPPGLGASLDRFPRADALGYGLSPLRGSAMPAEAVP